MRLAFAVLLALSGPALAQQPAPAPAAPLTIDQLVAKITELRAKCAEIRKQEDAAAVEIKRLVKELQDKLDKLGLSDPPAPLVPPAPAPPVDPLKAKLKAAFDAAAGAPADKAEWAKDLASLYRAAAKLAVDPTVATAAALKQKMKDASVTLVGPDALKEVRQVVALELAAVLPAADGELTDAQRAGANVRLVKLADLLLGLAGE